MIVNGLEEVCEFSLEIYLMIEMIYRSIDSRDLEEYV
jgi:hypothetical protein